jgi:hypothetical protein
VASFEPFVAMYVPKTKTALLIGIGDNEEQSSRVRQRCIDEGVSLGT